MNGNRGMGISGFIAIAWVLASLGGIFYSLYLLFTVFVLGVFALMWAPSHFRSKRFAAADTKLRNGEDMTDAEMLDAADWYMRSEWYDYRKEDLRLGSVRHLIPTELHEFIMSERELPRRMAAPKY